MAPPKPRNDRENGVTKFCRSLEEHRRTESGRVKTSKEFLDNFFPYDMNGAEDRLFPAIPREVRGPVISGWGVRGVKSAIRDDDDQLRSVVHDALMAGDVDDRMFEEGVTAEILVDWVPLADWWAFWRSGRITGAPVQRALALARELGLFDDRWFLDNVKGRGGRLSGTDVVCDTLPKDQIIGWIRNVHGSGDGSPSGLVSAIGWETILAKTSQEALLYALDAFAQKVALAPHAPAAHWPTTGMPPTSSAAPPTAPTSASAAAPSSNVSIVDGAGTGEVAIPDFGVSEMPPVGGGSEWPEDPFPPAPPATYGLGDAEEEPTNERRKP